MSADTIGGVWHYALELARGLGEYGVRVDLATFGEPLSADQQLAARAVPNLRVHASTYRLEWMHDPWADVARAGEWLLALAERIQPDVIHLNHYCHGSLPWSAPVIVVAHSCVYSWFEAVHRTAPDAAWERYRQAVARGLAGADLVVAPSRAMLAAIKTFYGPLPSTEVIFNGRRSADFPPGEKKARILTAGRLWDEGKNVAALARIAPRLDWPVRFLGSCRGPNADMLACSEVEPRGPLNQKELAREYGEAAIYASPARYEPFGLSILEAALAGAALVLGDIPSLREVWGKAAQYVSPQDDAALFSSLNKLIQKVSKRHDYAARARCKALTYSATRMSTSYLCAYERLRGSRSTSYSSSLHFLPPFVASRFKGGA